MKDFWALVAHTCQCLGPEQCLGTRLSCTLQINLRIGSEGGEGGNFTLSNKLYCLDKMVILSDSMCLLTTFVVPLAGRAVQVSI